MSENREINVLQCHGGADQMVPLRWGELTRVHLNEQLKNPNVVFKVYPDMGHSGCADESKDTKEYLTNLLAKI